MAIVSNDELDILAIINNRWTIHLRPRFTLHRDRDLTGISGTGVVAEGFMVDDRPVIRWLSGEHRTVTVHPSIRSVVDVHCHGGATRIVWDNREDVRVPGLPMTFVWVTLDAGPFGGPGWLIWLDGQPRPEQGCYDLDEGGEQCLTPRNGDHLFRIMGGWPLTLTSDGLEFAVRHVLEQRESIYVSRCTPGSGGDPAGVRVELWRAPTPTPIALDIQLLPE